MKYELGQKGQVAVAVGVLAMMIALILCVVIYSAFGSAINQHSMTAVENSTIASVKSYALTGIGLLAVGILVMSGFAVIGFIRT